MKMSDKKRANRLSQQVVRDKILEDQGIQITLPSAPPWENEEEPNENDKNGDP